MKMAEIPTIKLNNGYEMPVFGLGTWQGATGKEEEVKRAVKDAVDLGYRLFDCAHVYCNEKAIGDALQEKIKEGVVKREELFITSKLWCNAHRPDLVEDALRVSLKNLQLDYLDLYLIHWPMAFKEGDDLHPKDSNTGQYLFSDVDYVKTWRAMENVYRKNLTVSIGVSNFNKGQLERVVNACTVMPQVNQVECHPYLNQAKLRKYCIDVNMIRITAYSPLGGPKENLKPNDLNVLNDVRIKEIAGRYGKTPSQVLLRYNFQLGNVVIPKSTNKERLAQNINIFDFYLAPEDMSFIKTLDCKGRTCLFEETKEHKDYPFRPEIEF